MSAVHLGTSGWTYDHWKDRFYPSDVPKRRWFEYFAEHFKTVELNASFYRIPQKKAVHSWMERSPGNFVFAVKMSRLITHVHKLHNCGEQLDWFFDVFKPLRPKIGAYLIQTPPSLHKNKDLLAEFIDQLPETVRAVFEFRHPGWYADDIFKTIDSAGHAICIQDMRESASERIVFNNLAYIRWHGYHQQNGGNYPDDALENWADWIAGQRKRGVTVFGYFNNDIEGFAVNNCKRLIDMVNAR